MICVSEECYFKKESKFEMQIEVRTKYLEE